MRLSAVSQKIRLVLVVAVAENGVIGRGDALPWRLKSDMQHFRRVTMGKPVIMGRKTYLSIGKPLAGRTSIVLTRDIHFAAPQVVVASSLDAALDAARADALRRGADSIMVIGGADVYAQTLPIADTIVMTRVRARPDGDVSFPALSPEHWKETEEAQFEKGPGDEFDFAVVRCERVR